MDWAFRLHLPLRAVVTPSRSDGTDRGHAPVVEKMKGWGSACAQRGIVLEMFLSLEGGDTEAIKKASDDLQEIRYAGLLHDFGLLINTGGKLLREF